MIGRHAQARAGGEEAWDAAVDVALERQNGLNWCWAAVAKGIVEHYGGPVRQQCQYATTFLRQKRSCCRRTPPPPRCDVAHDLDSVLARYGVLAAPPYHRAVSLGTLARELRRDRPVVALMRMPHATHAVVIRAVDTHARRIEFVDPWYGPAPNRLDADGFERAYEGSGRWFYTLLTRPAAGATSRPRVSLLRHRAAREERTAELEASMRSEALEVDFYDLDPVKLARGAGLREPERVLRRTVRLDVGDRDGDAALRLDEAFTALRAEIEARTDRGFEVRLARCFAIKLETLWFTDPADPTHRRDHYLAVPPVPHYLDADREYRTSELARVLAGVASACMPSIEADRRLTERLASEAACRSDDPSV